MKDFFSGHIYQDSWIYKTIEDHVIEHGEDDVINIGGNKMLNRKDDHYLILNDRENTQKLNIGKKKQFTIVEGLMLFKIMNTNNSENMNKNKFWDNI